jgi:1,4-alpha-glucan branching enzyme
MNQSVYNPRGMGAIPSDGATRFRVWAPHAESVAVVGEFNGWDAKKNPLQREENGLWSVEVPGAKLGQPYQFELVNGDKTLRKNDAYARQIDAEKKTSVIYDGNSFKWSSAPASVLPKWNEIVLYELHVGTFGRDKKGEGGSGGFDQIISQLPYLKSLGINALEIMPLMAFPSEHSWGYSLTNPFAVEPSYGTPDGLKRLVDVAHALGIALILDIVINHFGPDDLDLWQYDGWSENGKGGIYFYNDHRAWTPWGENRPDFSRGEVRQYLRDSALLWLEEFRFDGLRVDATLFIRNTKGKEDHREGDLPEGWTLMQWINDEVERFFPGRLLVAEDLQRNEWITRPTGAGGLGYHTQWDPAFVHPIRQAIVTSDDNARSMDEVAHAIEFTYNGDPIQRIIYSESHDQVANGQARVPQEINPDDTAGYHARKRSSLAAGLVMTTPGIPMIFEGQEFLEDGWFRDNVSIDWTKLKTHRGINRLYRDLIHLRRNLFGVTKGLLGPSVHVHHFNNQDKVVGYHRWLEGGAKDDVVVIASFTHRDLENNYRIGFPRGGRWIIRFNSDWKGYSKDFHEVGNSGGFIDTKMEPMDGFAFSANVDLPSYGLLIFSQDKTGPTSEDVAPKPAAESTNP